jgi:hypothetical protein
MNGSRSIEIRTQTYRKEDMEIQEEDGNKQAMERLFIRNQPCRHLNLGLLASITIRI